MTTWRIDLNALAERIQLHRVARGWSVNELARRAGFFNGTPVSRLERAEQTAPSIHTIAAIANALEMSIDRLVGLQ